MSVPLRINRTNVDPTVNDDFTLGYQIGWAWANTETKNFFVCTDPTEGAAVWELKPTLITDTFTPELAFGGSSLGIMYNDRVGNYVRVGNSLTFNIYINLSSKGSENGNATITGLPFANGSNHSAFTIYTQDVSLPLTYLTHGARIAPAQQFIRIFATGSLLGITNLDDGNFQNDSQLFISGTYFL